MTRKIVGALFALLILAIGWFLWDNCHVISANCCEFDSDADLLANFDQNESEFNALIEMAKVDSKVTRIAFDFTQLEGNLKWPRPESELGFSRERWDEYKRFFEKLEIRSGLGRRQTGSTYLLYAKACGLFTNRAGSKGYAYSPTELSPQVESLDDLNEELVKRNIQVSDTDAVYKKIRGNWYLYQDF